MPNILNTAFQQLDKAINGNWASIPETQGKNNTYSVPLNNDIIFKTKDKREYDAKKLEYQQNEYLAKSWYKANSDLSVSAFKDLNNVKLMYRDAELMDAFPEIGAALDIVSEEATVTNNDGKILNVYSDSPRIKSILEDLFVNRLDIHMTASMIVRGMCKYGNHFMLLNVNNTMGVIGWRQMPVFSVERVENNMVNPYSSVQRNEGNKEDNSVKFVWSNENGAPQLFKDWQIGHFRLLTDSIYLPYGCSYLNKARRHFRMLSLMEDMMFIYRLERSIERRVFKIYVGGINDKDVPAYVQTIANNFKRSNIVDPMTGQVDLRKNLLDVNQDYFVPVRDPNASNPIDTLNGAQNLTAMDDIKYVQNKVVTALRIPKSFLNFEDKIGDGQNLSLMDVRFTRTVNKIQQAFLVELSKIAMIHLYLLGFQDDLTNFSLTMNNPSTQSEMLNADVMSKKVQTIRDCTTDPGVGFPIMSMENALKTILHWSDDDIRKNLEEIRLEKALANELTQTPNIIIRTGFFDRVDRIYGEPNAKYPTLQDQAQSSPQQGAQGGGMGGGMPDMGGGMPDMGGEEMPDMGGEEGEAPSEEMGQEEGNEPPQEQDNMGAAEANESKKFTFNGKNGDLLSEEDILDFIQKKYPEKNKEKSKIERSKIYDDNLKINEELEKMFNSLDTIIKK